MSEIAEMALDLLAGSVVFQVPNKPNKNINLRMGFHRFIILIKGSVHKSHELYSSGATTGIVAGSKTPSYCVMGDTAAVARVMEKMGEGMRIHISSVSKELLDKLGGYR